MLALTADGASDGIAVVSDINYVAGAFAVLLAGADVDDGRPEIAGFAYTNAGVPDQHARAPQDGQELTSRKVSDERDSWGFAALPMFAETLGEVIGAGVLTGPQPENWPVGELLSGDGGKGFVNL